MSYSGKLKDPRWQKKRLEIFQRDEFKCRFCGDSESTLHVHHLEYNGDPWETENELLLTLCEACHEAEHEMRRKAEESLLRELKRKRFSYSDVLKLSHAVYHLKLFYEPEVMATVIDYMFGHNDIMKAVSDHYFDMLKNRPAQDDLPY